MFGRFKLGMFGKLGIFGMPFLPRFAILLLMLLIQLFIIWPNPPNISVKGRNCGGMFGVGTLGICCIRTELARPNNRIAAKIILTMIV